MNNFTYYIPTKVFFGENTVSQVGSAASSFGATKVMLHFGSDRVKKSGLLSDIEEALTKSRIEYMEFGGVIANPRLSLVRRGVEVAVSENVDMIIAIGGGSVIDSAKAIAYGVLYEGDVWEIYTKSGVPGDALPVGVVLTMAASGSEMSDSSVISNEESKEKRGYNNDLCRPKFAILDPSLTLTLPPYQTACGCVDIIMHTFERYFTSRGSMEITDQMSEALIRTVMNASIVLRDDPDNVKSRAEVMWAGSLSHNGLMQCGNGGNDFATHKLEHEVSAKYDVAHGAGLAALWGSWARYVFDSCPEKFYRFAVNVMGIKTVGLDTCSDYKLRTAVGLNGIEAVERFFKSIDMPTSLGELNLGITDDDLKDLSHRCAAVNGGHIGACRVLDEDDMLAIYRMAL